MESTENRMGTLPVPRLVISMSLPVMISMLVLALYNIVDSVFVSMYSETALAAVSLAFPLQNLMNSVAIGTAVGLASLISRKLGAKDRDGAEKAASQGITLAIMGWAAFVVVGAFLSRTFFMLFSDDATLIAMGTTYTRWCLICSLAIFIDMTLERIMQATGDTVHPMIIQLAGAFTNIILDPILIFGLLGLPRMGIAGAAIATVIGQHVSALLGIIFIKKNRFLTLKAENRKLHATTVKEIYAVGLPSIIMQSIGTVMISGVNKILVAFGMTPVSVFGVYFKLQSFVFMPVFGLNSGLIPIVGFNYGARKPQRMNQAIRTAVGIAVCIMALGTLAFNLCPELLLSMFNAKEEMMRIGKIALPILSLCFVPAGISICMMSLFQAVGDGMLSMLVSLARQLFVLLPSAWILARFLGLDAVWFAFIIAEGASLMLVVSLFVWEYRRKVSPLFHQN